MRSLTAAVAAALVLLPAAPAWAANQPPAALDDAVSYRNTGGIDYVVPALANDTDPDGDLLTYTAVTPAAKGNAYLSGGKLYYKPYLAETGTDTFTYTVSDGQGNTATATVTATLWVDPAQPLNPAITSSAPGSVTLTWSAAARAAEYRIRRNGVVVGSTSGLDWTDTGLSDTASYEYRIVPVNGGNYEGTWATPLYRRIQMPTPTGVAVDITGDPTTLSLTWDDAGMSGPWQVYRDGVLLTSATVPRFEDTGLVTGREYGYQVQLVGSTPPGSLDIPSLLSTTVRATPVALSAINRLFWDLGWTDGDLGPVTVPERAIPGGRQQDHQRGIILQQDGETPFSVTGSFRTAFTGAGGATGYLGFPLMQVYCDLRESGCAQLFEGGSIWSSGNTPTRIVRQVIEDGWAALGWEEGPLGYPIGDQVSLTGGAFQDFEGGAVYWSAATGSHGVASPIYERWAAAGWERGALGYPIADEIESEKGLRQSFKGGTIWWSPTVGAQVVSATLQPAWARSGWDAGPLGEPTAAERVLRNGRFQTFTGGSIYWSPTTGAQSVRGAIRTAWGRSGWENGPLGYPTTEEMPLARGGGRFQKFQGGSVYWSPTTGAYVVRGAIRDAWGRSGWENGPLGYPITDEMPLARGGGRYQKFQGGSVYWSPTTGAYTVKGAIRDAWGRAGWENGALGYPLSEEIPLSRAGGRYQKFQGGSIYWTPTTGAHPVKGAIRAAWGRVGWENGRLGYPTTDETGTTTTRRQTFQGGTITLDVRTGRTTIAYR